MQYGKVVWVSLLFQLVGCVNGEDMQESISTSNDEATVNVYRENDSSYALGSRSCTDGFFCNSGCACEEGFCVPDGFGPSPPADYCAMPPLRACQSAGDCRSMCDCQEGFCQPDGFGPSPPADYCALPPLDENEQNDSLSEATSYLGSSQVHTFHDRGDVDWMQVYFGYAGYATFETSHLNGSADTYMSLYRWNPLSSGYDFVVDNDNKCHWWWSPFCWGSRIGANVSANSVYAVRVTNQADGAMNIYDPEAPSYSFTVGF
jgi:hypothetical protein